jgi:hypothetical protein
MVSPLAQAIAFQNSVQPAQTPINPTNVLGAYQLASDVAEKNYQAKLAQQNALWGGLAQLGGAGILGFGPSLAKKWLAGGATPAAADASAAGATTTGIDAATGAPVAASSTPLWTAPAAGAADAGTGSIAADLGLGTGAADAAGGTVAADLGAAGAADAAGAGLADAGAAGGADWLLSILPFLA